MTVIPPAPDISPSWQVRVRRSWTWFRSRPTWLQVAAWVLCWWILPAWWLVSRARGPVGVATAALVAVLGLGAVAAATGVGATDIADPGVASATVGDVTVTGPIVDAGPTSTPSPTASRAATSSPSVVPSDAVTPTPSPSPAQAPRPTPTPTDRAAPVETAQPEPTTATAAGQRTTVERVVDGDTLYLAGLPERARLIGIDTPETVKPGSPVECFGPEASAALERLVPPGTEVRIVFDVERTDQYDRPLVYLHRTSDDLFVNRAMVRRGFAQVATYPPNVAHVDEFVRAQRDARDAGAGLWSADCGEAAGEDPEPTSRPRTGGGGAGGGTSGGDGDVAIADIVWDGPGDDVEYNTSEHVVLRNDGDEVADVGGWSLTDLVDHRITIPDGYRIPAGGELLVHTGPGDDTDGAHHDGASQAIWNNSGGDTATLRDDDGEIVDQFSYSS